MSKRKYKVRTFKTFLKKNNVLEEWNELFTLDLDYTLQQEFFDKTDWNKWIIVAFNWPITQANKWSALSHEWGVKCDKLWGGCDENRD
jgi:hypothetical protein